ARPLYPRRPREDGGGAGEAALPEAVLPQPQFAEPGVVGGPGDGPEAFGGQLGAEHRTECRHGPFLPGPGDTGKRVSAARPRGPRRFGRVAARTATAGTDERGEGRQGGALEGRAGRTGGPAAGRGRRRGASGAAGAGVLLPGAHAGPAGAGRGGRRDAAVPRRERAHLPDAHAHRRRLSRPEAARRRRAHHAARSAGAAPAAGPARTGGGGRGHGAVGAAGGGACGRGAASGRARRGRQEVGREVGAGGQSRSSGSVTGRSLTTPTRIIGASASDWLRETA